MATSSVLPVCDSVPCVISRGVPTVFTPEPSSMPTGRMLPLFGSLRADALHVLVDEILEFGALALEAGGRHVGDVAGDDLDLRSMAAIPVAAVSSARMVLVPHNQTYELGGCESCCSALRR